MHFYQWNHLKEKLTRQKSKAEGNKNVHSIYVTTNIKKLPSINIFDINILFL